VGEGSYKKTILQMLYHIKEANAVFITKVRLVTTVPINGNTFMKIEG
jgi:hypothetical protein